LILSRNKIILVSLAARPVLGPTKPPNQKVSRAISLGLKWLGCEANHPPSCSADVRNGGILTMPLCLHGKMLN
jgi:hypothetical protein